jgi:solute carrier family 50 protein (sugar transporter)
VIKTKSVEFMPFFLSFFLFLNAGIWSAYAVLVQDFFIGVSLLIHLHTVSIYVCVYIYINVLWKHFQVPNGVGVLLGSAQLILYAVYKNKSNIISTKSTEKMEEEGSAHLVKGIIQMQAFHEDDEEVLKNRSLNKGRSLPKPPVNRQYSFQRILKTFSLSPYEIHANYAHEDDVENGEKIHP